MPDKGERSSRGSRLAVKPLEEASLAERSRVEDGGELEPVVLLGPGRAENVYAQCGSCLGDGRYGDKMGPPLDGDLSAFQS